MSKFELWELSPVIEFYIHHDDLAVFVKPVTNVSQWTLMVIKSGTFSYEFDDKKGTASDGDLFFGPPDTELKREIITPMTFEYMRLDWYYPDGTNANKNSSIPIGKINISNIQRVFSNVSYMQVLSSKNDRFSRHWMNHIVQEIWYMYCADVLEMNMMFDMTSEDALMNHAVEIIKRHACEKINFKELAHEIGLSPVQFTRRFKAAFRIKPLEYLTSLRIQRVQRLLIETDYTLSEIAQRSGYQNEFYLSNVFTRIMKITPSEYRRKYK